MRAVDRVLLLLTVVALAGRTTAQPVSIDRGVRAGGLWCFPVAATPDEYVYIPYRAALATDDAGAPQFSFIRYALENPAQAEAGATITAAGGGGILNFLVVMETPEEMVAAAERELAKLHGDENVTLRGPVVFTEGSYALVSSIINPVDGDSERKLLATGRAPVLEGNRLALSFDLDPTQATLLLESFKMATPDVSLVFDMTVAGLTEGYDAELTIDWSEVHQSKGFSAGGSAYFVGADVELMFDELTRNHAIQLRSSGSDASMEALLNTVYNKLLELMFRRVRPERVPAAQRGGLMDAIGALIDPKTGPLGSRGLTGFGLNVGFQLKDLRSAGTSVLNFNHRSAVERHSFITFNIGDLYQRYGDDDAYFKALNLADPVYQQREVHVAVDGALVPDFDRYINSVTVTLRKRHADGDESVKEVLIDPESLASDAQSFVMVYGWSGDDDRLALLSYEYRTRWSFKAGGTYETEWVTADAPMIDVFAPYERRTVQLLGSAETLKAERVRAVVVRIEYPFFGQVKKHQLVARADQPIEEQAVEIVLPQDQFEYDCLITWYFTDGQTATATLRDTSGLVFVDEVPEH